MSGKLIGKTRMVPGSFRAEPEQLRKFAALGGGAWMRAKLDAEPWPRGTEGQAPSWRPKAASPVGGEKK
jgi:hypothetical protein